VTAVIEVVELGHLKKQDVVGVHMSRADFMECVESVLEHGPRSDAYGVDSYAPIADAMRQTAAHLDRFPLGEWLDADRGCGCVVGEYMVLNGIIDREIAGGRYVVPGDDGSWENVLVHVRRQEHGDELLSFGYDIDREVRARLNYLRDTTVEVGDRTIEFSGWYDDVASQARDDDGHYFDIVVLIDDGDKIEIT
jgi:hypothetical protein